MSAQPLRMDWLARAQSAAPVLLAAAAAAFSWWLVSSAPQPETPKAPRADQGTPDYELSQARLARFDPRGRLEAVLDGQRMRHFPATQTLQIDAMQLAMRQPDGRRVLAQAQSGKWSEVRGQASLAGQADVRLADAGVVPPGFAAEQPQAAGVTRIQGERLDLDTRARVLTSSLPVTVQREGSVVLAQRLRHDEASGVTELGGRVQGRLLQSSPK